MKKIILILTTLVLVTSIGTYYFLNKNVAKETINIEKITDKVNSQVQEKIVESVNNLNPLSIDYMKKQNYPGSEITLEQTLPNGSNYKRYVVSYLSEGYKIYALLTVPVTDMPIGGYPAIIFNHGYIPPKEYRTTEKYVAYQDAFAKAGYVTIKSDYRGHGSSKGEAVGGYGSPAYTIDVLNAVSSIKELKDFSSNKLIVNKDKLGMWGHSMGGYITLRSMVVSSNIKAGVIWAGVVASYPDLINNWRRNRPSDVSPTVLPTLSSWRQRLIAEFGEPSESSPFWKSISANSYLDNISGPVQLHHGTADTSVPVEFSTKLTKQMQEVNKEVEYFEYAGDDHNLANNLYTALNRSVAFFDKYLK